jgi:hypothetical protein
MQGIGKRFVYIFAAIPIRPDTMSASRAILMNACTGTTRAQTATRAHRPWSIVVSIEFPTEREALRLERYLKSGSGRAFAKRHFATNSEGEASAKLD